MSEAASNTPYSSEYLSLLARKGKLGAKKIDNVWYTTKSVVDDYMKRQMMRVQIQNGNSISTPVTAVLPSVLPVVKAPDLVPTTWPVIDKQNLVISAPLNVFDMGKIKQINQASLRPETLALDHKNFKTIRSYVDDHKEHLALIEKNTPVKPELPSFTPAHREEIVRAVQTAMGEKPVAPAKISSHFSNVFSNKILISAAVVCVILFTTLPIPLAFSLLSKSISAVKGKLNDASTVTGFRPGTGPNELLLLDKHGNISIMGHIKTDGQFQSFAPDGTAPFVVDSKTEIKNLNTEYVGGLHTQDFTLAYITKNGSVTTEDVKLEGNVDVGKTLNINGATKLRSSLEVDGSIHALGDAEFKQMITVLGPAYFDGLVTMRDSLSINKNLSVRGSANVGQAIIARNASFGSAGVNGDLSVSGDTKINTFSAKSGTIESATTTNLFVSSLRAAVSSITSFIANDITVGGLTATNSTTTNEVTTNASTTNATTTNSYISKLSADTGTITNLFSTNASVNFGTFTNILATASSTLQNFTFTNATGTNATTTNFFSTLGTFNTLTSNTLNIGSTSPLGTLNILQSANGLTLIRANRMTDVAPTGDFITIAMQRTTPHSFE